MIRYSLAALGAEPSPALPPQHYIVGLFDMYAETFDRDLVDKLNYQSPRLLAQLIARSVPADARLDILDIGCGTGLMGEGLRALKRTLTGVDLSPNMLEQARRRGIYDRLIETDIVAFLETQTDQFDRDGVNGCVHIHRRSRRDLCGRAARSAQRRAVLLFGGGCRRC
jgi:predicted TPR repeat methyltransferase